ncbi:acetate--CoA ligase family protein [Helicobacter bilis]|uniref:acetate--CoA ligase family protein n=1 Tax=Helicobacter bilis TaxID=37372 RepID=UPI0026EE21A9|nr:acetate--CoA ligase family protein [Helicobacter bilis]MCI7412115.1 acetate--CoA ligase family protein [Helicobacter bilis]MDD7296472.1 acetate--CoA ligase family protein [Helicobacter bilis]MDY4399577.1 acetate--CoA ligase family protein [Helicobacter bilis]
MQNHTLSESELYSFLGKYGIKTPACKSVGLREKITFDAFPAIIKIQSSKVVHKSDVGGVILNLTSNDELEKAREQIIANLKKHNIELDSNDGFIITQMVFGEELYIGSVEDSTFGNVILFGKGGIYLELYKDVCYIESNAREDEIKRALATTKIAKLFDGFRGFDYKIEWVINLVKSVQKMLQENEIKELDINPLKLTKDGLVAVDARILKGKLEYSEIQREQKRPDFLKNERVVIVGASTEKGKTGYTIAKNAQSFKGELLYVNAKGGELFGKKLYKSVSEIDGDIDTAVIVIGAKFVIPTIHELVKKGLKNLIIITAGFKESGHDAEEEEIGRLAATHDFNVIGPNCLGFYANEEKLNITFGTGMVHDGSHAFVSQSGAVLAGLMDRAAELGLGFSHLISVGNAVDLRSAEIIPMLNNAKSCESIALYLEGVARGKSLCESIRNCNKPIYLFKAAKSEAAKKAAFSHTGNLSGNYAMFNGIMQSLGVKVVNTLDSLLFAPLFKDVKNIVVITNAGGPGTVLTDAIAARKKELYELSEAQKSELDSVLPPMWSHNNPIDVIGDALPDRYESALKIVDTFPNLDLIYMLITPQDMTDALGTVKILKQYTFKHKVVPILLGGENVKDAREYCLKEGILYFTSIAQACEFLG